MNGKGSSPRPINDREDFRRRWEETFSRQASGHTLGQIRRWFDEFDEHHQAENDQLIFLPIKWMDLDEAIKLYPDHPVVSPPYDR